MNREMFRIMIQVSGAFLAIYGFAVLLDTPKKYLFHAGGVGAAGGLVYLICIQNGLGVVFSSFISALVVAVISHIFARIFKTPVTLFLIAGFLPTVPGAGMYRIVHYILEGNEKMTGYYLIQTLQIAGVFALAIFIIDTVFYSFQTGEWKQNSMKYIRKEEGSNDAHLK